MHELLLVSLNRYYSRRKKIEHISQIVNGTSITSLRLIDWYVTSHCKKNNIVYIIKDNEYFNVYLNYRSQLKAFKKVQFDPFRRRERIPYTLEDNSILYTTIGQLNFFRWAIENKVLETISNNLLELENSMMMAQKKKMSKQISSIKKMTTFEGNAHISFS
jgi:hypothetical protein